MQNKNQRSTSDQWFVSISSYNSGLGLSEESVARVTERLDGLKYKAKFLVNEHENKHKQTFEHLHFYFKNDKIQSQDNVKKKYIKILKDLKLYNHKKDLDVKQATHPAILIGGYLGKDDKTTILLDTLTTSFKKYCIEQSQDYTKRVCILKGRKCPTLNEAHLTIYEFICRNKIEYDTSLPSFKAILKLMIESHEYSLTSLMGRFTKIKTMLDCEYYNSSFLLDRLLDNDYKKETDEYQCNNMHIEHNNITQHHHPMPEEIPPPMTGSYDGKEHIPLLTIDDKINFEKWGET